MFLKLEWDPQELKKESLDKGEWSPIQHPQPQIEPRDGEPPGLQAPSGRIA